MTTKPIRQITELLGVLNRGDDAQDATLELEKVLKACQDASGPKTKVKGKLTVTLDITVEGSFIVITADISSKVPKIRRGSSSYFLNKDGQITTEHPQQQSFDLGVREVRETRSA